MKKKVNHKSSLLETPTEMADFLSSSPNESPKSPLFTIISDKKKKSTVSTSKNKNADKSQPTIAAVKTLGTISDLKDLASSRLDHLKRHIEHSHSEIIKDLQASHSRLHKRFKVRINSFFSSFLSLSHLPNRFLYIYLKKKNEEKKYWIFDDFRFLYLTVSLTYWLSICSVLFKIISYEIWLCLLKFYFQIL